jgi:uncharacterized membrane protein YtjA (UPF0391 family)
MLLWAVIYFINALIYAVLGFTGIASTTAIIAKALFFIFLFLSVLSLTCAVFGLRAGPRNWRRRRVRFARRGVGRGP